MRGRCSAKMRRPDGANWSKSAPARIARRPPLTIRCRGAPNRLSHERCRPLCSPARSRRPRPCARPGDLGCRRRDRETQDFPEPLISELHEVAAVPPAAAALAGRRGSRALGLSRRDRGDRPPRRLARLEHVRRQQLGPDRALHPLRGGAHDLFGDPRGLISWGPPNQHKLVAAPGRLPRHRRMAFLLRLPPGHLDRRARQRRGTRRLAAPATASAGRPCARCSCPRRRRRRSTTGTRSACAARRPKATRCDDVFVPEAFSGTREDPTLRRDKGPLYAFTMQGLYACGVAAVALGIARAMLDAFIELAADQDAALSRAARRQSRRPVRRGAPRGRHRLGARLADRDPEGRATAAPTTSSRSARPTARRVRLGCTQAIHQAEKTADWVYKAAGTSAIFLGTPFERRFRDIHTLSQQIQSREAHFENGRPHPVQRRPRRHVHVAARAARTRRDGADGGLALVGRNLGNLAGRRPHADRSSTPRRSASGRPGSGPGCWLLLSPTLQAISIGPGGPSTRMKVL